MNFDINKAIEILEQTPKTLSAYLFNLSAVWTSQNEGKDTWSAYDIVGHLIHGEKTDWMVRIQIILSQSNRTFEPFDRFAQFEASKGKTIHDLLAEFQKVRAKNLKALRELEISSKEFQYKGKHPEFGEVTLRQLLSTWVVHDLGHLAQMARVMAKQYKDEVGPWAEYLPILNK